MAKKHRQQSIDQFLKMQKPYLTAFSRFSALPPELRAIIWSMTLKPRNIEVEFSEIRGFYARVRLPVALITCRDSRNAVLSSYSLCFGNVMFTPRILFNFAIDTLYLGAEHSQQTLHLIAGFTPKEIGSLRYLAIDSMLNFNFDDGEEHEIDYASAVLKAVPSMVGLKEVLTVFDLMYWLDCGINEGVGPMKLYNKWPAYVERMHDCPNRMHWDGGCGACDECLDRGSDFEDYTDSECDDCDLHRLPQPRSLESENDSTKSDIVKTKSVWGWRPVKSEK